MTILSAAIQLNNFDASIINYQLILLTIGKNCGVKILEGWHANLMENFVEVRCIIKYSLCCSLTLTSFLALKNY